MASMEKEEYEDIMSEYEKMVTEELKEEITELKKLRLGRMKMKELVRLSQLLDQAGIPREEKRKILAQVTPYFTGGKPITESKEIAEEKVVNTLPIIAQSVKNLSEEDVKKAAIILQALRSTGQVDTTTAILLSLLGTKSSSQQQQQQQGISIKDILEVFKELRPQQQQQIDWKELFKLIHEEREKRLATEQELLKQQYQQQFQKLIETLNNLQQSLQRRDLTLEDLMDITDKLKKLGFKVEPSSSANVPLTEAEVQKRKLELDKEIMLKKLEVQKERDKLMYEKFLGLIEKLLSGLVTGGVMRSTPQHQSNISIDTGRMKNVVREVIESG